MLSFSRGQRRVSGESSYLSRQTRPLPPLSLIPMMAPVQTVMILPETLRSAPCELHTSAQSILDGIASLVVRGATM